MGLCVQIVLLAVLAMLVLASAVRTPLSFAEEEVEESSTPGTVMYGGPWVTCGGGRGSTTMAAVQCGGFNNRSPSCVTTVTGTSSAPGVCSNKCKCNVNSYCNQCKSGKCNYNDIDNKYNGASQGLCTEY